MEPGRRDGCYLDEELQAHGEHAADGHAEGEIADEHLPADGRRLQTGQRIFVASVLVTEDVPLKINRLRRVVIDKERSP